MMSLSLQHPVKGQQAHVGTISGNITLETLTLPHFALISRYWSPTCSHRDHAAVPQASSG